MAHSFVVYIDESGDEGFTFKDPPDKGSSDWFVLSAVIIPTSQDQEVRALAARIRSALKLQEREKLHFKDIPHEKRVRAFAEMADAPIRVSSVIIHKRRILQPEVFTSAPFRLYFYAARLLIERISWYCRDTAQALGLESPLARIIFEHRKRLSYDQLRDYLDTLKGLALEDAWLQILLNDVRIHWPAIQRDKVEAAQKDQYAGLQLADLTAGGLKWALEETLFGFTEHRYAKLLEPITYRRNGNCMSYGLKFFPQQLDPGEPKAHWVETHYR
ncbi:DUF3800 domain-containing protein [Methyloceanibacter caenitepidi]|uniref:DUF3800 domain-containing protein n=1 Tax=Methyloceanibacter caenitepidi TaxID=1384459 RepID=UPI0005EF9C01|nr:DUF3800 domain-containing protein [Methyloceanibacter caenitepidi]